MSAKQPLTYIAPPVPELPVKDVERAQQHYRDTLGFTINWLEPDKRDRSQLGTAEHAFVEWRIVHGRE